MILRRSTAVIAALVLSAGTAAACGGGDSADRESVEQSNEGVQTPEGGKQQVETGATTLESSGTQPTVTQTETGP